MNYHIPILNKKEEKLINKAIELVSSEKQLYPPWAIEVAGRESKEACELSSQYKAFFDTRYNAGVYYHSLEIDSPPYSDAEKKELYLLALTLFLVVMSEG